VVASLRDETFGIRLAVTSWDGSRPVANDPAKKYRDTPVDVKLVLSALWIVMLFVFAYVDIFGFYRADVLEAALDGKVATTDFNVDQAFLTVTLLYVSVPILMVVLSLVLRPPVNRVVNVVVSVIYALTIVASAIGEEWTYYVVGSGIEVVILVVIARTAWTWPPPQVDPSPS